MVRELATAAMRSLLTNLRRIATSTDREHGRYADLVRLAGWFDRADDETAHALWAGAFGMYAARHLGFVADDPERPVPPTASWWATAPAEVPVMLRAQGQRAVVGRAAQREDFSGAKAARLAERARAERIRAAALAELVALYAAALAAGVDGEAAVTVPGAAARILVHPTPGRGTTITSPSGRLALIGRTLDIVHERAGAGTPREVAL